MHNPLAQISDVTYNGANECFEAVVTLHVDGNHLNVASAFHAPMNTSQRVISGGLTRIALNDVNRGTAMLLRRIPRAGGRELKPDALADSEISDPHAA